MAFTSFFSLTRRNEIQSEFPDVAKGAVIAEFDYQLSDISDWASTQHNPDGTHNIRPSGIDFVPVGGMIKWPTSTAIPTGWLSCDGSAVSRASFPILFKTIGITQGAGNGTTTFNIPNDANFIILAA